MAQHVIKPARPASPEQPRGAPVGLALPMLVALVVGSMIGSGIFALPSQMAASAAPGPLLIGWTVTGVGMLMLAFVFQTLANRKPDLDAGVYAYARAGFGPYLGFLSALGYWASACVGNVSYWILIKSTLGGVWPVLGEGNTLTAVAISSVGIWAFHMLVSRGVKEAAGINLIIRPAASLDLRSEPAPASASAPSPRVNAATPTDATPTSSMSSCSITASATRFPITP